MSDQHTPGPFWFAKAEDFARFDYAVGAGNSEIAHVAERADAALFKAAPDLLAALRAVLPYAESRLEDMEECAEACRDCPNTGAEAEAHYRKCRDAFQAAQDAISSVEGRR